MAHTLSVAVERAQADLDHRFDDAVAAMKEHAPPREVRNRIDLFLIGASRHVSAFGEAVLPLARRTGTPSADYLQHAHQLERHLRLTKKRIYGEIHSQAMAWTEVWEQMAEEFHGTVVAERQLLADLLPTVSSDEQASLGERLEGLEISAPSRPHPHVPHAGPLAHSMRQVWARGDRIWDAIEGRSGGLERLR